MCLLHNICCRRFNMTTMKKNLFFLLLLCPMLVFAQIDQGKSIKLEGFNYSNIQSDSEAPREENQFDIKIPQNYNFSPDYNPNFDPNKTEFDFLKSNAKKLPNFMSQSEAEKDVLKIKYFNGKDMSNPSMRTNQELGKLSTTSKKIRIECRDHSYVDGDRVRVYLNEKVLYKNVGLEGSYFVINIDLEEGFNRIDIEALNQGSSGPNTAAFLVFDRNGYKLADKEWNMGTGQIATLVVMKN